MSIKKVPLSLLGQTDYRTRDWHDDHARAINQLIDFILTETVSLAANGGQYELPPGSGLLLVNDTRLDGFVGVFAVGGGTTSAIASSSGLYVAGVPAPGEIGVDYAAGSYRITNNTDTARSLSLVLLKSRSE